MAFGEFCVPSSELSNLKVVLGTPKLQLMLDVKAVPRELFSNFTVG